MSTLMTLNDLQPSKLGVLMIFSQFWAATHISRVNCTEMAGDRPRQSHMKFSALNVDYGSASPDPCVQRGLCMSLSKRRTLLKSGYFSAIALSSVKTLADRRRLAACHNKHWWRAFQWY